ncbi:P-loop containing nucleoside triphosphate hydrolase protein [Mrakia frigida]|uniref:uncharacterized protein n=1 Tax=Mrakia frigida TaxID=29902 RepID=UPI003FCC2721
MTPISCFVRKRIFSSLSTSKRYASSVSPLATLNIPQGTHVFQYGNAPGGKKGGPVRPLLELKEKGWKIEAEEKWAVIGGGKDRKVLLDLLLTHHRLSPPIPPPGRHPFLYSPAPSKPHASTIAPLATSALSPPPIPIHHLTFSLPPSPTGEFSDYTARYHALFESDRHTLLQTIKWILDPDPLHGGKKGEEEARWATKAVGIEHLLEVPFVGLSNGQTRRARLALALLKKPQLLVVEEPFAGLDPQGRKEVAHVLGELSNGGSTRVVLVLRGGEDLPTWITDVVEVREPASAKLTKAEEEATRFEAARVGSSSRTEEERKHEGSGKELVRMEGVDVSYGEKQVLHNISWTIRSGDRWHLQGHNGSGKTTLLSLLLGDHPRSFSLPATSLTLFGSPRRSIATTTLNSIIGHTSPEIFKAFPRSTNLTIEDAVGTGFLGIFSRRNLTLEQKEEVEQLLKVLFPEETNAGEGWSKQKFVEQPPAVQSLVLFARAMAGTGSSQGGGASRRRKELVVLDEPFAFMEMNQIERCRRYLRELGGKTAVVWVGHWEGERPWREEEGTFDSTGEKGDERRRVRNADFVSFGFGWSREIPQASRWTSS